MAAASSNTRPWPLYSAPWVPLFPPVVKPEWNIGWGPHTTGHDGMVKHPTVDDVLSKAQLRAYGFPREPSVWVKIDHAPKRDVVDLWGSQQPRGGMMRWPDCWWGPSFPDSGAPPIVGWYCRLGETILEIFPTHYMIPPKGPTA